MSAPTSRFRVCSSNIVIDRDTASRLGLTAQAVDSALYDAFGQRQVSVMYKSINQYHVVLALQQQWWENPDFLNTIYVQTPRGTTIPLSTFTHFSQGNTPISPPHQGQFPASTISFNLAEGVALSDAVVAINKAELDIGLPASVTGKFAGNCAAVSGIDGQPAVPHRHGIAGGLHRARNAVRKVSDPSADHHFHALPSAGVGALMALVLFNAELDIVSLIGIFLLIGIVEEERDHDDRFRSGRREE